MDDEYQRQIWRWCRDQEILERQKEVCELRDRLRIVRESFRGTHYMEEGMERSIDAALSRTEPVAGRWVSKEVADRHVTAALDALQRTLAERDAAIARAEKAEAGRRNDRESLMRDMDRVGADVADAIRARDEVGIQLAAAQAEIARLRKVADEARAKVRTITEHYKPGWVDGLKAVARNAGFDPDDVPHDGVDPPTFIEDVIDLLRRDVVTLKAENERLRAAEQDLNHLRRVTEGLVQRVADLDEALRAENERLRAAAEEVLSWNTGDMTMLLSNPPQNAGLFHAQRVLRKALGPKGDDTRKLNEKTCELEEAVKEAEALLRTVFDANDQEDNIVAAAVDAKWQMLRRVWLAKYGSKP